MGTAGHTPNFTAAGTILPFSCVKVDTTDPFKVLVAATENDIVLGVTDGSTRRFGSTDHAIAGDPVVLQNSEFIQLRAGGTIAIGDGLRPTTNGSVVTATSRIQFVACDTAVNGEVFWAQRVGAVEQSGSGSFTTLAITGTTASTSSITGALTVAGGVGIVKDSYINNTRVGRGGNDEQGNTVVGEGSLSGSNSSADHNTAVGYNNMVALTTGANNTTMGSQAAQNMTTGARNVVIGRTAGATMTTATENVVIGHQAAYYMSGAAASNTIIGAYAGQNVTTGGANVLIGQQSGASGTITGSTNVGVGVNTLRNLSSGGNNTALGNGALYAITTGSGSTAVGADALAAKTTGNACTAVGFQALISNLDGELNTALGNQALVSNMYGDRNVGIGEYALDGNKGDNNVGVGINTGYRQWTGADNVFIGDKAGAGQISGDWRPFACNYNTVIGSNAMVAPGGQIAAPSVTATVANPGKITLTSHGLAANTPVGFIGTTLPAPLVLNKTYYVRNPGTNDFEVSDTSGGTSLAITSAGSGVKLLYTTTAGDGNTVLGYQAGLAITTGANNILVGRAAGDALTTGSTNICIGYNIDLDSATTSNQINIGGVYFHNRLLTTPLTLAQLNALTGLTEGLRGFCTDSTTTTYAAAITGGGSNNVPCYYDGAWKVG